MLNAPVNYLIDAGKNFVYYIDIDEIPGFFLLVKNRIFIARSEYSNIFFHV